MMKEVFKNRRTRFLKHAVLWAVLILVLPGCRKKDGEEETKRVVEAIAPVQQQDEEVTDESESDKAEAETEEPAQEASFLFAGDICLEEDGFVIDYYDAAGGNLQNCVSEYLLKRMQQADIFMLNHEYTISSRGSRLDKYYTFRADPSRMNILTQMSVDVVSLANNHIYDYGYDAFCDTIELLDNNEIRHVGAGMNASEAERVEYFEVNGIRIGVLAASRAEKYVITPQAKENQPGVFWMYDDSRLKEVAAEAAGKCDFLVAYLHWGTEDSCYFEDYQHEIAQQLVDCGVDAIIGGHPHVVQGMEFVGKVPVLYSLGDFWFNGEDKYSMMVQLNIRKDGTCSVEIIPCRQKDYCVSNIDDTEGQKQFFDYLSGLSPAVNFG